MEGKPEQKYEDSYQKAERLWIEFKTIVQRQRDLIELSKKDFEAKADILEEIDHVYEELQKDMMRTDLMEKLNSLRDDLAATGGDLSGTYSILDSNWAKATAVIAQLKEMGEIE
ncbi:MAG: hypothetical protein EXS59_01580 [Candidatus Taylorbacteria bacterium]|nr:hypothetical protein [Candidatus Taylorbacteria bacterium]